MSPLVNPKSFPFQNPVVVIDARSGVDAYKRYSENHLQGALHVDLDNVLSQNPRDPAFGGRHPLPDVNDFALLLGKLGITPETAVVVYDDKGGASAAARFWWMLQAIGHKHVQVVDGGLDAMLHEGLPMTSAQHEPLSTSTYPANTWHSPTATLDDVVKAAENSNALVIDVREAYRYRGEREPIDLIAGHIPGAVNVPYINNLTTDGYFKSAEDLRAQYNATINHRNAADVIVHCGSGVTACHTLLALEQAGIKGVSLYVGSWGEWSRRNLPIATGEK